MPVLMQPDFDFSPPTACPQFDLPPEVEVILDKLHMHARGRQNAMTARDISELSGINERRVRALIAQYQHSMPCVIAGIPGQGFYITDDPEHMADYDRSLIATLRSIAARVRAFRINAARCGYERIGTHPHTHYRRNA